MPISFSCVTHYSMVANVNCESSVSSFHSNACCFKLSADWVIVKTKFEKNLKKK